MATWAVAEAKAKFSDVVEQAQHQGPQQITKNGRPVAVVVSMDEWTSGHGMTARKGSLAEFFYNSPLRGSGIRLDRVRLEPRPVEF